MNICNENINDESSIVFPLRSSYKLDYPFSLKNDYKIISFKTHSSFDIFANDLIGSYPFIKDTLDYKLLNNLDVIFWIRAKNLKGLEAFTDEEFEPDDDGCPFQSYQDELI